MHLCVPCQGEDSAVLVFRILSKPLYINAWRRSTRSHKAFDECTLAACTCMYTSTPLTWRLKYSSAIYLVPSFATLQPESDQLTAPGISVGAPLQSETHHLIHLPHRQRSRDRSHDPQVPREDEDMDVARSAFDGHPTWHRAEDSSSRQQRRVQICQAPPFGTLCQHLQPMWVKG